MKLKGSKGEIIYFINGQVQGEGPKGAQVWEAYVML